MLILLQGIEDKCGRIYLSLNNPTFINSTLPRNWLSTMRVNIHEFSILRGNLMHIARGAFMSPFIGGIRRIQFTGITIRTWKDESLVGLSKLEELIIKDCYILRFQANAFQAVDDTLETLSITNSNLWNPINVTGTTNFRKLTLVDFSFNYFNNILGRKSFTGLQNCKTLYLNSCKIDAIGAGAFDYLHNIEVIFLNDNLLTTIPSGLFENIMLNNPKPRLNLQGNMWLCDCSFKELRNLVTYDLLLLDPVCYYPEDIRGVTFSNYEYYCNGNNSVRSNIINQSNYIIKSEDHFEYLYVNGTCCDSNDDSANVSYRLHSPILQHKCFLSGIKDFDAFTFPDQISDRDILRSSNSLKLNFFLETEKDSVVQIDSYATNGFGLLWFHTKCPNEIYCIETLPNCLRVYNVDNGSRYTFCPFKIETGLVDVDNCIMYDKSSMEIVTTQSSFALQTILYISTGIICLIFGALCVYGIIRRNPWLLKGSKRIVFVKHKTVDALVLPPKIPLRRDLINETLTTGIENKNIFIMSGNNLKNNNLSPYKYNTQKSVRSNTSGTPSYISALQPTEDQLAEWRINNHFNNDLTITSHSDLSVVSWVCNVDSLYYTPDLENYKIYESL